MHKSRRRANPDAQIAAAGEPFAGDAHRPHQGAGREQGAMQPEAPRAWPVMWPEYINQQPCDPRPNLCISRRLLDR